GKIDHATERNAEGDFVHARTDYVAGKTKQTVSCGISGADARVSSTAAADNFRNIDERLDVIYNGRLAEQASLGGERRLVARLAAVALNRIEQRGLFAANVRARASAQLDVKAKALAQDVIAQQSISTSLVDGVPQPLGGQRIL